MRFKKGNRVEVFSNEEVPSGSWRCAEIICRNGHNYTVRYDTFEGYANDAVVERLPRKAIRPLPPLLASGGWVPRDVVEVYDKFSWKMATVLKVLKRKYHLVRLVGSTEELRIRESDTRVRQSWKDGKWNVVGKGFGNSRNGKSDEKFPTKSSQNSNTGMMYTPVKVCAKNYLLHHNVPLSQIIPSRTQKRGSPYGFSHVEVCTGPAQKYRIIENEKDGMHYKAAGVNTSTTLEQVDALSKPRDFLGKYAVKERISGFFNMHKERRPTGGVGCSIALKLSSTDDDMITCSVGSCNATSTSYHKLPFAVPVQDSDDSLSDAESVCPLVHEEGNNLLYTKEDLRTEVHKLELHAYCRTIRALHAAGSLSWEQEVMLTNLRVFLNISNEEHLMEVRKLVASASSIPIS